MSKGTILIVEDSFIVSYHLKTTLESDGYVVIGMCDSGEAAIQSIETNRPDLVLMDIMLTGKMDGIETAAIIKFRFNIPVIYITALTDKDTIDRAKITEPYGYLTKPFEDREIFTVIGMALYKHRIELKLKESEEKYFSTVNSISDAVVSIDKDFKVLYVNPSASALTGWGLEDAIGKPITTVLSLRNEKTEEENINPIQCVIGLGPGNGNRMPDDLVLRSKNGKELPIGESSLSPLLDASGQSLGLILVFKDLTEKKEHEKLLHEMDLQRKRALIEGQEKERERIAKDIHDGLGQMLNAIKMNVSLIILNPSDAANLSRLLNEAIQESIRISENLLPAKLRDFDLATCLKSLCTQVSHSTHSNISFLTHGFLSPLCQSKKINLYRIAQESVNNAIKHSKASSITVQLSENSQALRLSVEDDGTGLTNKNIKRQSGMVNMRDRAEIMGGKFTIESDPHRGTLVIVEVPSDKMSVNA